MKTHERKADVQIEVLGGVAYLTRKPKGVSVEIHDFDNEKEGHGSSKSYYAKKEIVNDPDIY